MRNHTLMQTIACANRVFPALAQAMAIYSAGVGGATPAQPKTQLAAMLRAAVMVATAFCAEHGVDLAALEALPLDSLDRLTALEAAIDALLAPDGRRRDYFGHVPLVCMPHNADDNRGYAGCRLAAHLRPGTLSPEVRHDLRAHLRKLPGTQRGGVCGCGINYSVLRVACMTQHATRRRASITGLPGNHALRAVRRCASGFAPSRVKA